MTDTTRTPEPTLGTALDRMFQRARDEEDAKRHGPQCFDGDLLNCGWPNLHAAKNPVADAK